jgi:hypothetical protein
MKVRALVRVIGPRNRGPSAQLELRSCAANGNPAIRNAAALSSVPVMNCNGGPRTTVDGLLGYRFADAKPPLVCASSSKTGTQASVERRQRDAPLGTARATANLETAAPKEDARAQSPREARSDSVRCGPRSGSELAARSGVKCPVEGMRPTVGMHRSVLSACCVVLDRRPPSPAC